MGFDGVDFYAMQELLSDEEILVRNTVRAWVQERVMPVIAEHYEAGRFPAHLIPEVARLGLLGATLPERYGCAGIGDVAYGLALQELERGDSGLRSFVSVQGALCMYPIFAFGSEAQREKWLPRMARGEVVGCFGLTEADGGSDPGAMRTRATRDGDGYLLRGSKMWITNGSIADLAIVWAKMTEGEQEVVRGFLVERGTPGFRSLEVKHKLSLRASVTSELVLDDVLLPAQSLLPGAWGLKTALSCLTQARYGIAWGAVGAAMACYDCALQYAQFRKQFRDMPIASHQLVQEKLVWMISEITKAQLLVLQVGRLKDQGKAGHQHISMAKRNNVWMALECARMARDILGANGVADEYPIMRHMCNLESVKTYEGTHDIHTLIVGSSITGIDAF